MSKIANFKVTLSKTPTDTATIEYETVDGDAIAGRDYKATTGKLTFKSDETVHSVPVMVDEDAASGSKFTLQLTNPVNCAISDTAGAGTATVEPVDTPTYLGRFNWIYANLRDQQNEYFGPEAGDEIRVIPKHVSGLDSLIINEAPDYGGETVSETASFWVALEAMYGILNEDWTGYNECWDKIEQYYVPSDDNQPIAVYDPSSPADYTPEAVTPQEYPRLGEPTAAKGYDPLYAELKATYDTECVYLMHWIIDVEGAYGFHNGDGNTKCVFINTYERGLQESSFETVTHPCWNDWNNGGGPYGFEPLYTKGKQVYSEATYDYGKKWSYTNAPDAEARAIQWSFLAKKNAASQSQTAAVTDSTDKARKMGDYLRYNLFDKYFRQIGNNQVGGTQSDPLKSCHYLINWYAAWGGEVPAEGEEGTWSYRIGCSEAHHGYQCVTAAYALATGGGGMVPDSSSAGAMWLESLRRQVEMIRWLQSPEGPIAGGVTNSYFAQYLTPTDGRENATFYGMHYVYAPVWHDPPSNKWVGFQAWGHGRTADLFMELASLTTSLATEIRPKLEVILDKLVVWFMDNTVVGTTTFTLPSDLTWTSDTEIEGETTNTANLEGVFEYLPSLTWDGTGDSEAFWDSTTVPNPNLHCSIAVTGSDLGVASSLSYMLVCYAEGKRRLDKFDTAIGTSEHTPRAAMLLAKSLLDCMWTNFQGDIGIGVAEERADFVRLADEVYIPSIFTGTMPNGDVIQSGVNGTDLRSFIKDDPMWAACEAYINGTGDAPVFTYHRFWAQTEFALGNGALHNYFQDIIY